MDYWTYDGESDVKDIEKRFNTEQTNERWIDYYEIFSCILGEMLKKSTRRRNRMKAYRSFHVETPESIYAIHHLVKTHYPGAFWDWNAITERVMTKSPYIISDLSKHLYNRYPNKWVFGAEGDGNTQSVDNIRSISNIIDNVQLFIASLKIGNIICMARILSKDGIAVFSTDQIDTTFKACLIYVLACNFSKISIARPNSNSDNFYYICEGFRGISDSHVERLENILRYVRGVEIPPAIFPKNKISTGFIMRFSCALSKATMRQKKKDIDWWIDTTEIQPIREHSKILN
jgi:hypothetical protein